MRNLKNDCVVEAVEPRVMFAVGPVDVAVGEGTPLRTITFTDTGGTTGVISVRGGSAVARFDGLDVTQTVSGRNVTVSGGATGLAWSTLTLSGRAPSATVRGTGGNEELVLRDGLLAAGPVRGFTGPAVVLRGTSTLGNGIAKLQVLRTEEGATLAINRGTNPVRGGASISIGSAVDTDITSQQPLRQLRLGNWRGLDGEADVITAPSITSFQVAEDFAGDVAINGNGVAVGRPLLANARVLGPVGAGTWNVGGKTARMSLGSTASQWTGNFGDVAGFVVAGDLSGTLSADSIRTLSAGTLTNADVFLNRPAAPRALGLGRLAARGAITDTLVRANADIGTVTAAALVGTSLCAGVTGMERGVLPAGPSDFFAPSSIRAVSLRGGAAATPTFVAGIIAAQNLGRLSLGSVNVNNGGAAFGVAADTVASLAGVTTDGAPIRGARLDQPSQSVDLTDFEVRVF